MTRRARPASDPGRFLPAIDVKPLDDAFGRRIGMLLGRALASDVIDAGVVLLSSDGDDTYTSDAGDLKPSVEAAGLHVELIPV